MSRRKAFGFSRAESSVQVPLGPGGNPPRYRLVRMGRRTIAGSTAPGNAAMGRTPRRWLTLSRRRSLVLVLLFGLWLGWQVNLARKQREAVAAVKEYGGFVRYD